MSLVAWSTSRDVSRGGQSARHPTWPPGTTHPYRVRVSGTGLTQSVVGSLAQFTVTACDEEGNKRSSGGDNFTVVMRGRGAALTSQPALVRTKLTDRGDGTYVIDLLCTSTGRHELVVCQRGGPPPNPHCPVPGCPSCLAHIRGSPFAVHVTSANHARTLPMVVS